MYSTFGLYLRLGFDHISDLKGYDHILFVCALCAVYAIKDWRHILWLVTAFTIGHSITLALATLRIVNFPTNVIEFLIPVTIFMTCLLNIFNRKLTVSDTSEKLKYLLAICFGFIHGLGFSNFLRNILDKEESIALPLFAFNVGLEIGQLLIVCFALVISYFIVNLLKAERREWNLVLSGIIAGFALTMVIDRNIF